MTYTRDRETHRERGTQRETERDTHTYTEKGGSIEINLEGDPPWRVVWAWSRKGR